MLRLDFINVGSGDAALIRVNDYAALVDCGNVSVGEKRPGSERIMAADFLREEGVTRLDLVVLTHLHRDHIGGFGAVLEAVRVDEVWTNFLPDPMYWDKRIEAREDWPKKAKGLAKSLAVYLPALARAHACGTRLREVTRPAMGVTLADDLMVDIGCLPHAYYHRQKRVLCAALAGRPDPEDLYEVGAALNETSLRLRLRYHAQTVILAADAYGDSWRDDAMPCTVLKVPHHASVKSIDRPMAHRLCPKKAVISCGAYRGDERPHPDVVAWLREASGEVLCTDACETPGLTPENHRCVTVELT